MLQIKTDHKLDDRRNCVFGGDCIDSFKPSARTIREPPPIQTPPPPPPVPSLTAPQVLYQVPSGPPLSILQQIQPTPEQQALANRMVQQRLQSSGISLANGGMRAQPPYGLPVARAPFQGGYGGLQSGPLPLPSQSQHQMIPSSQAGGNYGVSGPTPPVYQPPPGGNPYFGGMYNNNPPMPSQYHHLSTQSQAMHHTNFSSSYNPRDNIHYGGPCQAGNEAFSRHRDPDLDGEPSAKRLRADSGGSRARADSGSSRPRADSGGSRARADSGGSKGSLDVVSSAWAPPNSSNNWQPSSPLLMPMNESAEEARERARELMRQGLLEAKKLGEEKEKNSNEGGEAPEGRSRANSLLDAPMTFSLAPKSPKAK